MEEALWEFRKIDSLDDQRALKVWSLKPKSEECVGEMEVSGARYWFPLIPVPTFQSGPRCPDMDVQLAHYLPEKVTSLQHFHFLLQIDKTVVERNEKISGQYWSFLQIHRALPQRAVWHPAVDCEAAVVPGPAQAATSVSLSIYSTAISEKYKIKLVVRRFRVKNSCVFGPLIYKRV